jgi:acetyl-CoA carboxylase biotin carboxyl carrier protein
MTDDCIEQVRQLAGWLGGSGIELLELSGPGRLIRLRRGPVHAGQAQPQADGAAPSPAQAVEAVTASATVVRANSVGVLLHAHPLREQPLAALGDEVAQGQVMALLKVGTLLLPVTAPCAGIVSRVLAANESIIGWGEPLFELA